MTKFESPYDDWPKVTPIKDGGGGVHITGRFLAPGIRHNIYGAWVMIGVLAFFWLGIPTLFEHIKGWVFVGIMVGLVPAYFIAWQPLMSLLFSSSVDVRIFRHAIQAWHDNAYRNYDRRISIEIKIEQHHKAFANLPPRPAALYKRSIEVVMWYGQKRIVLAELELEDLAKAQSLVLRLQEAVLKLALADTMSKEIVAAGSTGNDIEIN